jgi:hypothetical protein
MSTPSPNLVGVLLTALLATFVLTPILSLLVLRRYRRAVRRSMHCPPAASNRRGASWSEVRGPIQPRPRAIGLASFIPTPRNSMARSRPITL